MYVCIYIYNIKHRLEHEPYCACKITKHPASADAKFMPNPQSHEQNVEILPTGSKGLTALRAPGPWSPAVHPIKLETGLRPHSAGIPYALLLRIEAIGFPTFGLLL